MAHIEGLWVFEETSREGKPQWKGFGIAYFHAGHLYGGDSSYYWIGTYQHAAGEQYTLQAEVSRYNSEATETVWGFFKEDAFKVSADIVPQPGDANSMSLKIRMSKTLLSVRMRRVYKI